MRRMQFKTLRSDKEGAKLFDVLAKSCFSIEIKLSHQLYSLAQFIIPRGENFDTNFLGKVRWAEAEMEEDTYSNFYIQAHLCHERGSFHHQM